MSRVLLGMQKKFVISLPDAEPAAEADITLILALWMALNYKIKNRDTLTGHVLCVCVCMCILTENMISNVSPQYSSTSSNRLSFSQHFTLRWLRRSSTSLLCAKENRELELTQYFGCVFLFFSFSSSWAVAQSVHVCGPAAVASHRDIRQIMRVFSTYFLSCNNWTQL